MKAPVFLLLVLSAFAGNALGELPPPSPQEKAAQARKEQAQQAELEKQKQALARVQERVARRYRSKHPVRDAVPEVREEVQKEDVPKAARQPVEKTGAHSETPN